MRQEPQKKRLIPGIKDHSCTERRWKQIGAISKALMKENGALLGKVTTER